MEDQYQFSKLVNVDEMISEAMDLDSARYEQCSVSMRSRRMID